MAKKYSLYEIIKPKLSPRTQKKLEDMIRYNELVKGSRGNEENL